MSAAANTPSPLVFVYDRNAGRSRHFLELRIAGCKNTATRYAWEVAGEWIDRGDDALDDVPSLRPRFMEMAGQMAAATEQGRPVLCLVHNWDRLSRSSDRRAQFQRLVAVAGGWTVTTFGETDGRGGTSHSRPHTAPAPSRSGIQHHTPADSVDQLLSWAGRLEFPELGGGSGA